MALHLVVVVQGYSVPSRERLRRRAVPPRRVRDAPLQRGRQHDRLERRGGRAGRDGVVEVADTAVASVVPAHRPGRRIERHQRGAQVRRLAAAGGGHLVESGALDGGVDGGHHPQPTGVQLLGGDSVRHEFVLHLVHDQAERTRGRTARARRHNGVPEVGRLRPVQALHRRDDPVPAVVGGLRVDRRVEVPRILDQRGEHGALCQRQPLGGYPEVRHRGRLDAVRATPEVDRVEVALQHLVLGVARLDLHRQNGFPGLARGGPLLGQVRVAHVLLGDGRGALAAPAHRVGPPRPHHATRRDAHVVVEVAVLRGEHRPAHVQRYPPQWNVGAVVGADPGEHGPAVAVVQHRRLRHDRLGWQRHRGGVPADHDHPGHHDRENTLRQALQVPPATPAHRRKSTDDHLCKTRPAGAYVVRARSTGRYGTTTSHTPRLRVATRSRRLDSCNSRSTARALGSPTPNSDQ